MDLGALEAAGLYDPTSPTAGERREHLAYLIDRGATVDQLTQALADGRLEGVASDLVSFPAAEPITLREAAARSGVSAERLRRIRLAVGLPADDGDETVLPGFVVDDVVSLEAATRLLGDDAVAAFTRVLGASAARIVETGISIFYDELEPQVVGAASELERAQIGERASAVFALVPSVVTHLLQEHFRAANRRWTRFEHHGRDIETGVGFVDLVGSTRWAEALSLHHLSLALGRFESIAWDAATRGGGRLVKLIGDEAMFVGASADAVCDIALELVRSIGAEPALPGARGAVGFGTATARDGDYFGPLVNRVARATMVATEGAVVLGDDVAGRLHGERPLQALGPRQLRGTTGSVRLYALT